MIDDMDIDDHVDASSDAGQSVAGQDKDEEDSFESTWTLSNPLTRGCYNHLHNLGKNAATTLDNLSTVFPDKTAAALMERIPSMVRDPDWMISESALLAVGAASIGKSHVQLSVSDYLTIQAVVSILTHYLKLFGLRLFKACLLSLFAALVDTFSCILTRCQS